MIDNILNIIHQEISSNDITKENILYKGEVFTYFDSGLTRHVFVNSDKTKVIKFLVSDNCINYNQEESLIYQKVDDETKDKLASTTLELDGNVIEQEFCNPIKWDDRELTIPQLLFAKSCRDEVGWDNNGKLKCFDLSEYKKW